MQKERISLSNLTRLMEAERPRLTCYAYYRLGNEADAQDAVQDTFLRINRRIADGGGNGIANWKCYAFRILSNLCSTRLNRGRRLHTIPIDGSTDMAADCDDNREEEFKRIDRLLGVLPEEQAEVIKLRIYGSNSFAEIAEILSTPLPTVKSRFLYGLAKLRRAMKDNNQNG